MRLCLLLLACAESFPLPMTAAQLAEHDSGPALAAYLSQPDASPEVCDLGARGPHLSALDERVVRALMRALVDGNLDPQVWRRCASALLRSARRPAAVPLVEAAGQAARQLLGDRYFEAMPSQQAGLAALQQLYVERPSGLDARPQVASSLFDELRRALARRVLGPIATRQAADLLTIWELEQGRYGGRPVDAATLDFLVQSGDEATLRRFSDRLPSAELRAEARRRVVRLHIAASPFPEVRAHAEAIEKIVLENGTYPIALGVHRPRRAFLSQLPVRGVLVRQDVWHQTATLYAFAGDRTSVLPEVSLRGALTVEVEGLSRPVTLCGPPQALDPTPCISPREVRIDNPFAYLDEDGAFHFVDHVRMADAVELTQKRDRFVLPVSVAGQGLLSFNWGLWFERPDDLIFTGARGPDLQVTVEHRDPARFVFETAGYLAVVEASDAAGYRVGSRGASGASGTQGYAGPDGAAGSPGMSASCPGSPGSSGSPGGNGGNGGPGGPGGRGGDGGNLYVALRCSADCAEAAALLRANLFSIGGPGGAGGRGGRGGRGGQGGSGGSSTYCTDSEGHSHSVSGGSQGQNGSDGSPGSDGPAGAPGFPGQVQIRMIK